MIPLEKLAKLTPRHRMRKAALVLGELERSALGGGSDPKSWVDYVRRLSALLASDAALLGAVRPERAAPGGAVSLGGAVFAGGAVSAGAATSAGGAVSAGAVSSAAEADGAVSSAAEADGAASRGALEAAALRLASVPAEGEQLLRAVDGLRHALLAATGQAPADWDLIDPVTGKPDQARRRVRRGLRAYLEDLRSPFNVGTIFRTADAFGIEELVLSPCSADPRHPRALRSAMGAVDLVPWRRGDLAELAALGPVFALELGGVPAMDFDFPVEGTVVLGSEELGLSAEALEFCSLGKVSIPMAGAKGSLNVAVAFGILLYAWTGSLRGEG